MAEKKVKDEIEETLELELNGFRHHVLIRGEKACNPVVIWVHGGPASPDTMLAYYMCECLKGDFTFVAYNERGCGKTYFCNKWQDKDNDTATLQQLQADLDALVDYARCRFNQEKIIVVGHSFGTMICASYCREHGEKVLAYVGVSQMGGLDSQEFVFAHARQLAVKAGRSRRFVKRMDSCFAEYKKEPCIETLFKFRSCIKRFTKPAKSRSYVFAALSSPYMSFDYLRWFAKGIYLGKYFRLNRHVFDCINRQSVYEFGTRFSMPVGFISGSDDWVTPVKCMEDYCNYITAPVKKIKIAEGWGHALPQENPQLFGLTLKEMLVDLLKE